MNLTKNLLIRKEMWCVVDNHNFICHICAKGFVDCNFSYISQNISIFREIAPNFTYSETV